MRRPLDKLELLTIKYPIHQMQKKDNAVSDLKIIAQSDHYLPGSPIKLKNEAEE